MEEAKVAWERRSKEGSARLSAAVAAAMELDPGTPAAAAADAEVDAAAAIANVLGNDRAVRASREMVFVARETRRRDAGRLASAYKAWLYRYTRSLRSTKRLRRQVPSCRAYYMSGA